MRAILAVRAAWGAGMLLAPATANRAFGAPVQPTMTRAFAAREALLGLGGALAATDAERRRWFLAAMAGDAADALGALAGLRAGELERRTAALSVAGALGWLGICALTLRAQAGSSASAHSASSTGR